MIATSTSIPHNGSHELIVYDLRIPGSAERLHRERAAWAEHGDIEALDENHCVLIGRPGAALEVEK